jgi:hypothetical protein
MRRESSIARDGKDLTLTEVDLKRSGAFRTMMLGCGADFSAPMQFEFTKGNVDDSEDGSKERTPQAITAASRIGRWGEDSPAREVAGLENDV